MATDVEAANDAPADLRPEDVVRMGEFLTHAMVLLRGEALPFTLILWHPDRGALHVSTVERKDLVIPLRRVAAAFEAVVGAPELNSTPAKGNA